MRREKKTTGKWLGIKLYFWFNWSRNIISIFNQSFWQWVKSNYGWFSKQIDTWLTQYTIRFRMLFNIHHSYAQSLQNHTKCHILLRYKTLPLAYCLHLYTNYNTINLKWMRKTFSTKPFFLVYINCSIDLTPKSYLDCVSYWKLCAHSTLLLIWLASNKAHAINTHTHHAQ